MDDWVFTVENHPFINLDISALDAKRLSVEEVRSLLSVPKEDHEPDEKGMDDYKNNKESRGDIKIDIKNDK